MVRKMISLFPVLALLVLLMTSCSKETEYTNAIPADVSAAMSVNLNTLIEKAGLNGKDNEAMKQKLTDALKSEINAATFQQLEKIIKNPSESGIDVDAPVYLFTSTSLPYPAVLAKVGNVNKLRSSLEAMEKEQLSQPVTDETGFQTARLTNGNLLAFNETTALIISVRRTSQMDAAKTTIGNLLKQTAKESGTQTSGFRKMLKTKGDITFFASMDAIPTSYARQITAGLPSQIELKDLMTVGGLSFEKGKIAMQFENYSENEEINALIKKQEKAITTLNTSLLPYFPESTLAFLNIGANGEEFYNLLQDNREFRNNISVSEAGEVKKLLSSFNGDISVGLINVTMNSLPTFVAYAEAKNKDVLKALYDNKSQLKLKRGTDLIKLGENEYVYKSKEMNVFFGIRDKKMYATNDELLYKNIGKPLDKSIKDTPYVNDMKGKSMFFVINMDAIVELPVVKMLAAMGGEEVQTYFKLASQVSYFEISGNGPTGQIDLILKDKDVNALKQIVDFARQFAGV